MPPGRKKTIRDFLVPESSIMDMTQNPGIDIGAPIQFIPPSVRPRSVPHPPPIPVTTLLPSIRDNKEIITTHTHTIPIFTDGGTWGNGKADSRGSYAVYIPPFDGLPEVKIMDRYYGTPVTNNRCELAAILMALKFIVTNASIFSGKHIRLYSDSEYSIKSLTQYIGAWKRNGWRKADGKPVMNTDMIREIDELIQIISRTIVEVLEFIHVRSHQSEPSDKKSEKWLTWYGNDRADKMTNEVLRRVGPVSAVALRGAGTTQFDDVIISSPSIAVASPTIPAKIKKFELSSDSKLSFK